MTRRLVLAWLSLMLAEGAVEAKDGEKLTQAQSNMACSEKDQGLDMIQLQARPTQTDDMLTKLIQNEADDTFLIEQGLKEREKQAPALKFSRMGFGSCWDTNKKHAATYKGLTERDNNPQTCFNACLREYGSDCAGFDTRGKCLIYGTGGDPAKRIVQSRSCSENGNLPDCDPSTHKYECYSVSPVQDPTEFGMFDYSRSPGGGWVRISSLSEMNKYKDKFIEFYNRKGGIPVIASWKSHNCCFTFSNGIRIGVGNSYQFPWQNTQRCNGAAYKGTFKFHGFTGKLASNTQFSEIKICGDHNNPGIYRKNRHER